MSYQILTRKDYDFYECSSAFQKSIRRNEPKDAIFFGMELYCSGYSNYVWKRLMVIASEDIGTGDTESAILVQSLFQSFKFIAEKDLEEASIPFIHAVLHLCSAKKSRIVDKYKIWALKSDYRPDVPDYALDVHTRKGKMMGRNHKHFLTEGQVVLPESDEIKTPDFIDDFYFEYLTDYAEKKVTICGYDADNITHKSIKDMATWKQENSQQKMF
jgi:replication-associated recombination protein RarA